jgi:hypothetical protein
MFSGEGPAAQRPAASGAANIAREWVRAALGRHQWHVALRGSMVLCAVAADGSFPNLDAVPMGFLFAIAAGRMAQDRHCTVAGRMELSGNRKR